MTISKKSVLSVSLFILILWGVVLSTFANPPTSPYGVSQNITDPSCPPGGTNCYVATVSIGDTVGNNPDQNGILYTNATGQITTDPLFVRDAVTKVSQILRPFTYSSGYSYDVDIVPAGTMNQANPFIDGETVTFYEYAASSIAFSGTGIDDLSNSTSNFYGTYPTTYTVTVASSGTPDTFDWTDGTNSGTGVSMSTSSIPLSNGVEISFGSDKFHIPGDSWSWTYSSNSVGTATLIHQEVGSPFIFQFYSSVTGTPDIANYVVGATSGATVDVANYFGNQTFTASENVFSISTNYVISPIGTITSVPGADNYIISGASGFDQYSILANEDDGKYGGIISSTSTPIVSNAQAGFITNDNILGLGVDGSGILFDNTDNSDYGFTGIFNQNGISGGIRLNQEGIMTTLDMSKTGFGLTLNDGSHTTALTMDFENISLSATHPSNGNMTGIVIDSNAEGIEIGSVGSGAKITVDNETDGTISLNTSNSPSSPSIQLSESTGKIRFNQAYTFPLSAGSSGQVLALDGSGNLEWTNLGVAWDTITGTQSYVNISGFTNDSGYLNSISGLNISQLTNDSGYVTSSSLSGYTPNTRTLTINGTGYDLSADRSWTIPASPITVGTSGNTLYSSGLTGTGQGDTTVGNNIILGFNAGNGASFSYDSNFLGYQAGRGATSVSVSNFLGHEAGYGATNAYSSNFLGNQAGYGATGANNSNFLGNGAGNSASGADKSNFFGFQAGYLALNPAYSNFFGFQTGYNADNASNSIFIGRRSGYNDTVNNTGSADDYSILIGKDTSTGGYSNSIAIGGSATNTAANQFMIGSATRPIDTTRINGSSSTQCTITTGTGIACTSDERVKTNIADLSTSTLENLLKVKTVTYNWLQNPTSKTQIGFLAQDLEQYFPELVDTDSVGMKSVYYAQMTPILVEAIREMNMKITNITNPTDPSSIVEKVMAKLIKADRIETKELCVDDVCVTRDQFLRMVESSGQTPTTVTPSTTPDPTPDPLTCVDPQVLNQTGDACIDPVIESPAPEIPPTENPPAPTE